MLIYFINLLFLDFIIGVNLFFWGGGVLKLLLLIVFLCFLKKKNYWEFLYDFILRRVKIFLILIFIL